MNGLDELLARAMHAPKNLSAAELAALLAVEDEGDLARIFAAARELKARLGKDEILPRGLIETSNICQKNCSYCGIRAGKAEVPRYHLSVDEVLSCIAEARQRGYNAIALQAGELESEANTDFYEQILCELPKFDAPQPLEVTLSLGEQTEAVYRRWQRAAGKRVLRYLIRIETSNAELYARIHPKECSFARRLECIRTLKRLGYVTGSGVMIGIPGQTVADLANDIVFYGRENLDMVGMGPYLPGGSFELALKMIALTRLYLHQVNIVSATALAALKGEDGYRRGIDAGANVIMPRLTPDSVRAFYRLY